MSDGLVKILDGNTFVVSDARGDIEASLTDPTGLFSFDTRFLSKWVLTVNGERLNALSVDDLHYFETRFFLVPGTGTVYVDAKLSVIRRRAVGNGFHEELTILNHDEKPVDLTVRVEAGCDFADLFEVKDALEKKGTLLARVEDGRLRLGYERDTFRRATRDLGDGSGAGRQGRPDLQDHRRAARRSGPPTSTSSPPCSAYGERHKRSKFAAEARPPGHGEEPRALAGGRAARRVRLGLAQGDLPAQPRRSRRAALLAARRFGDAASRPQACRGS